MGLFTIDQEAHAQGWLKVYAGATVLCSRRLAPREHPTETTGGATDAISAAIQQVEDVAEFGLDGLDLEELAYVSDSVNSLTHAWPIRAEAVKRAYDGWLLWREDGQVETRKTYKLQAIAKTLHVHWGTARQEYDVADTFTAEDGSFARHAMQSPVKDFSVWRAAASKDDPWNALRAAQEVAETVENASTEAQVAAMEDRAIRQWWVRIPEDATPGSWVLYKDLEREHR